MPLPPDAQAAKDRMDKANAVLLVDVENSTGTETARREELVNELQSVLVQPEMDSGRSPLASIAPFSAGQSATAHIVAAKNSDFKEEIRLVVAFTTGRARHRPAAA